MHELAQLGKGVAMLAVPDVVRELESGTLVRLVPNWYADAGMISIYYASRKMLPSKARVFVDWVADMFKREEVASRFSGLRR